MMEQCVAAFTFSKSYSMSGWRLGFAVSSAEIVDAIGKMINTTLSCTPPIVQLAGRNALLHDGAERNRQMGLFREKVDLLTAGLNKIPGFRTLPPQATRMPTKTSATNHPTGASTWAWRVIGRSSAARGDCWD